MTALSGPIVFNNSASGSDTAASGCGPATAVSVMIQTSAGSNTATASWTGTISAGDLMYIPDSSFTGRKFNVIASVGSGSLTFDNNWDDSSLGTSGYVGGKRATFDNADSRELFTNFHTAVLDKIKTETDQSLTSEISLQRNWRNPLLIYSDDQRTISNNGNYSCFEATQNKGAGFYNLKFVSGATSTEGALQGGSINVQNCVFGAAGSSYNWKYGIAGRHYGNQMSAYRCRFFGPGETVSGSFALGSTHYNSRGNWMIGCFADNYEFGFYGHPRADICKGNVITSCAYGASANYQFQTCANNVFHDISSDCIRINNSHPENFQQSLYELGTNIFSDVSGHLITSSRSDFYQGDSSDSKTLFTNPGLPTLYAYNSSNTFNNMPTFPVQTLSASPFVDASNGNFTVNSDTLKAVSYSLNDDTKAYPFSQFMTPVVDTSLSQEAGSQVFPFNQWATPAVPEAILHPLRSS